MTKLPPKSINENLGEMLERIRCENNALRRLIEALGGRKKPDPEIKIKQTNKKINQ